jgi:4'-phosphopantetheinyl transferase
MWSPAPENLTLCEDEVHVWRASIDGLPHLAQLEATLTDDERARANRFRFPRDRERYIAARGQLRALLSRYLNRPARDFRFTYTAYGKPALVSDELRFNVSHSHQLALFAFAWQRDLGVDVEYIKPDFGTMDIAESTFSLHEFAALRALSPDQQTDAFFNCWTRKEAYIKAIGEGLSCR